MNTDDIHSSAVRNIGVRNRFTDNGSDFRLACLVRAEDMRPLRAPWWKGKEVSVLAVDVEGNFVLRHSGGAVIHWSHLEQEATHLADSVRQFLQALRF